MNKKVIDFASKRAERDERRSRQQLYPKSGLVTVVPRSRPASLPPFPSGDVGRAPFDDGPEAA